MSAFVRTLRRKTKCADFINLHINVEEHGDVEIFMLQPDQETLAELENAEFLLDIICPLIERCAVLANMQDTFRVSALSLGSSWNHVKAYRQYAGKILDYTS